MANSIFVDPSANGTLPISGTVGALLYWATANTVGEIPDVATGQVLASGGVGTVPAYTASPSVSGVLVGAGSVGTPAVRFSGDPDNGLYYIGTNNWGLSAGGALALDVSTVRVNAALPVYVADGTSGAPSLAFSSQPSTGLYFVASNTVGMAIGGNGIHAWNATGYFQQSNSARILLGASSDAIIAYKSSNVIAQRNGAAAQAFQPYGYLSGSREAFGTVQTALASVTLSGATSTATNLVPAGAFVIGVATTTTTTITGASGYTVGDGSDADRWGDITGTAVGTNSKNSDATANPTGWFAAANNVVLTAKTSNFTGGVVQVVVFYLSTGAA